MMMNNIIRGVPSLGVEIGPVVLARQRLSEVTIYLGDHFEPYLTNLPHFQWIPINEISKSWGYLPFFQFKVIMDLFSQVPTSIYVCCAAGAHRSPMMVLSWLLSYGYGVDEAVTMFKGDFGDLAGMYYSDVKEGYIPKDLLAFYKQMGLNCVQSYRDVLINIGKYESIGYSE